MRTTHYIWVRTGAYPGMVRDFHRIISEETKKRFLQKKEDFLMK